MSTGCCSPTTFGSRPKIDADAVLPPLMVTRKTMEDLESLSKNLALPPDWMMARLLEAVIAERNIAGEPFGWGEGAEAA